MLETVLAVIAAISWGLALYWSHEAHTAIEERDRALDQLAGARAALAAIRKEARIT